MDYEDYEEANYWFTIFSIIDLIERYSYKTVMRDLSEQLDRKMYDGQEEPTLPSL